MMDTAGVEWLDFNALGGADKVTVDDLIGTGVGSGRRRPRGASGRPGDGDADRSSSTGPSGTTSSRQLAHRASRSRPRGAGDIQHQESLGDRLAVNGSAAANTTRRGPQHAMMLTLVGGDGEDILAAVKAPIRCSAAPATTRSTATPEHDRA